MNRVGIFTLLTFVSLAAVALAKPSAPETAMMPLAEIKPGMEGTWRTVVSGNGIEEFNLKILGVSDNFAGPNSPVIIAEALDASQILSGPVAGMSGSPCYIDGKLIGAYAYGYLWPKEQAIIGITPIEEMLKVFEKGRSGQHSGGGGFTGKSGSAVPIENLSRPSMRLNLSTEPSSMDETSAGLKSQLKPTPTPLFAAGISGRTLDKFRAYAQTMNLDLMSTPVGSAASLTAGDIEPGSPVGGVLLSGDFSIVATGTCTWREGNDFLAFGHPFLQGGAVDIPIAPAEIITIVRSLSSSFKLSNVGPIVGSIYQDRLTAVAGEVGRTPQMTDYSVVVTDPSGVAHTYAGKLFQNEAMSPYLAVLGLYNSASATMETADNLTYNLRVNADFEGYDPLIWTQTVAGSRELEGVIYEVWDMLGMLVENPFEPTNLKSLRFDLKMTDQRESTFMDRLQILSGPVKPGEPVELAIRLKSFRDESVRELVKTPIPSGTAGQTLSLFVGDAAAADRIDDGYSPTVSTFGEILDYFRSRRDNQHLYVKLLRSASGVRARGQSLEDLPPSALSLLDSSQTVEPLAATREITLWETSIKTTGAFTGSHRFSLPVEN